MCQRIYEACLISTFILWFLGQQRSVRLANRVRNRYGVRLTNDEMQVPTGT